MSLHANAAGSSHHTFAVETYMRRAYNYLDNMADEAGRPYFNIFWFQEEEPAMANHDENDCPDVTSRQWQASILARHMTGQQCHYENVWAKTILARLDPETGLLDPSITPYIGGNHGLVLYALATAWADRKDPVYRDAACRMITHLPSVHNPKDQWSGFQIKSIMTCVRLFNDKSGLEYAGTLAREALDRFGADNKFGGHTHCGLRTLSGVVDYAIYVKDEAMLARVDALYRDARSKGTRFGWLPEMAWHAGDQVGDQVGCETCALMDFVALSTTLANNGHPEYWGDIELMLRNQLAESQVVDVSWLNPGDKPDTKQDTWCDVGSRMIGGWAGWSSPTHIWSNGSGCAPKLGGYRAFMNCCGGSGDTALFTAWKNASRVENGVLSVNMHIDKLLPQAEIRCHQPYQGYLSIALKEACKVRVRVPDFVEAKDVKVSSNKGEVKATVENGYLELGPRQAGEKIEVTYPVPVKEEDITIGNPGHKQYHYRVTWKGDTVVRMTPIGEQYKTIRAGWGNNFFDVEAYYGEEGPGRLYQREYMLKDVVPEPSPLHMDDGMFDFWLLR